MKHTDPLLEMACQLRQDYIYMLLKGIEPPCQTLETVNRQYCFAFPPGIFAAFILRPSSKLSGAPVEEHWLEQAEEYIHIQFKSLPLDLETRIDKARLYCILGTSLPQQTLSEQLAALFTEIQALPGMYTCQWTMGVGQYGADVSMLSSSLDSAQHALKYSVVHGTQQLYDGNRQNIIVKDGLMLLSASESAAFKRQVQNIEIDQLRDAIPHLFEKKQDQIAQYPVYAYMLALQVIQLAMQTLRENMPVDRQTFELEQTYEQLIDDQPSLSDLIQKATDGTLALCGRYQQFLNSGRSRPIWLVITYIQEHFAEKITLEELARYVDRNPQYLSAAFTREYGVSLTDYIVSLRIEAAKRLLRASNAPISEIARRVSYSDPKYFSRIFQKQTGISPRAYRLQQMESVSPEPGPATYSSLSAKAPPKPN